MICKNRYTYTPICDGCGKELDAEPVYDLAVGAMKLNGWEVVLSRGLMVQAYHFCPVCSERRKARRKG